MCDRLEAASDSTREFASGSTFPEFVVQEQMKGTPMDGSIKRLVLKSSVLFLPTLLLSLLIFESRGSSKARWKITSSA